LSAVHVNQTNLNVKSKLEARQQSGRTWRTQAPFRIATEYRLQKANCRSCYVSSRFSKALVHGSFTSKCWHWSK